MIVEILISFCICASLLLLLWYIRGSMLRPVRTGRGVSLRVSVKAEGSAPELDATVDSLLWLIENGTLPASLELLDCGMDAETRAIAEIIARDNDIEIRGTPDG